MKLEMSLKQKQILSQRMQLSVNILQMNAMDLDQHIREEALENPLIELEVPQETEDPAQTRLKKLEWLERMDQSNFYKYPQKTGEEERDIPLFEKNPAESLYDTLLQQLPGFHLPPERETQARYVIGNLDENGYLTMPRDHLRQKMGATEKDLDQVLEILHRMDPPGVGAQDLRDCLRIQIGRLGLEGSRVLVGLVDTGLDLLAKNQLAKLAKQLNATIDQVKEARDQLLTLNPKPGNGYSSYKAIPYIRPDLFVVRFGEGFQVILNDYNQPRIEISSYYRGLAKEAGSEAASYINDKLGCAEWLVSCIQQRKNTILRCAGSILRRQGGFFRQGPGNLVPMTLADVAEDLEMHPSTISRATRGKYLQCQWGVFALGDFFSRGIRDDGEHHSQDMIQNQIRRIIEEEDPRAPLSDRAITEQLQKHGIQVARRTVAKYREQMEIPTASRRKKF